MTKQLLSEEAMEAWMYILETLVFCGHEESIADKDFTWFVSGLASCYPDEFELVLEVFEKKEYLNGL
jgi:hypothetical protein